MDGWMDGWQAKSTSIQSHNLGSRGSVHCPDGLEMIPGSSAQVVALYACTFGLPSIHPSIHSFLKFIDHSLQESSFPLVERRQQQMFKESLPCARTCLGA